MPSASTLITVKDAILTRLRAKMEAAGETVKEVLADPAQSLAAGDVGLDYAHPGQAQGDEHIWLVNGLPADADSDVPTMKANRKTRNEEYTVGVVLEVRGKDTARAAEVRALALLAYLDGVLADDPRLGLGAAALTGAKLGGWSLDSGAIPNDGFAARFLARVDVDARLT